MAPPSLIVTIPDAVIYIKLVLMLALAFAVAFQLPLVIWTLGKVGIFDHQQLRGARKYALFGCVVVAAILTPTADPVSLALLAVPLYGLYELGILLVRMTPRDEADTEAG